MISSTFKNLPAGKKRRVEAALLLEFSRHALAEAKVSRIVAQAQIARGAFYKYFGSLQSAYAYLRQRALASIHVQLWPLPPQFAPQRFYRQTAAFLQQTRQSPYYQFICLDLLQNQAQQGRSPSAMLNLSADNWAAMVLCHAAIKLALADPSQEQAVMHRLQQSLSLLKKGA